MLVYRLCISVLLTCELHLIGLSQINTRWSVTSPVLTHCLRDYVNVFSMIYLLPVLFMLLVSVQVIVWKDQLLRMTLSYNLLMATLSLTHSRQCWPSITQSSTQHNALHLYLVTGRNYITRRSAMWGQGKLYH